MIRLAIPLFILIAVFWLYFFMQRGEVKKETRKALRQFGIAGTSAVIVLLLITLAFSLRGYINV